MSSSSLPEPVVFFIDRCLGKHAVANALRTAGASVEIHADHFSEDEPNEAWLTEVARRGWVVLTSDKQLRRRKNELGAILATKAAVFVLASPRLTGPESGDLFAASLPSMLDLVQHRSRPFIAGVSKRGITNYNLPSL